MFAIAFAGPLRRGVTALFVLLAGCAAPWGSGSPSGRPTVVVAVVGLDHTHLDEPGPSLPRLADAAQGALRWSDALSRAPGLTAVTGLLSTEPNPSPLPPPRLRTPGDRPLRWLTLPPRLASRPEARRLIDHDAVGRAWPLPGSAAPAALWVAVFDPLDSLAADTPGARERRWREFDLRLERWREDVERALGPGAVRWLIAGIASPPAEEDRRWRRTPTARPLLWIAPDVTPARHDHPVLTDDLPAALAHDGGPPRLPARSGRVFRWAGRRGGEVLRESPDARSWQVLPPARCDLEVWARGGEEVTVIDLEVEATGGIEDVRPIALEEIDDLLRPDDATLRLQLATGPGGDGARLRPRRPDAWLRLRVPGRTEETGLLGIPFHAGPSGQGLGRVRIELAPLSRGWWRCRADAGPGPLERGALAPGVHLWLLPPASAGE